jgi:ATP synthase protein I
MYKTLLFQCLAVLAVTAIAGSLGGMTMAKSVLIGGAAYVVPNLLFVLRLRCAVAARETGAVGFMLGEAVKLFAVMALLLILTRLTEVNWPALITGLFIVLLVNLFALLLKT